nr:GNAT family N-acetyltransferase [Metabacillus halosaccharovorans]
MKRSSIKPITNVELPKGYSFSWFTEGKEEQWAKIETSVGEFQNTEEALKYFHSHYSPYSDELRKRLLFVKNKGGEEIGTITSWWDFAGQERVPSIHWFAVINDYQGYGLGKALVSECLDRLLLLEGQKDVFLHTQTWSYKAIGLYLKAGFEIIVDESFANYNNDYERAMPVLKEVLNL